MNICETVYFALEKVPEHPNSQILSGVRSWLREKINWLSALEKVALKKNSRLPRIESEQRILGELKSVLKLIREGSSEAGLEELHKLSTRCSVSTAKYERPKIDDVIDYDSVWEARKKPSKIVRM